MNIYDSILEYLYKNQDKGFLEISHICPDKEKSTRIAKELKKDGLIIFKQKRLMGSGKTPPFRGHPKLEITRLGIEKYEREITELKGETLKMDENTIQTLESLKNGKSITLTKDSPNEISELIINLKNLGVLHKPTRFGYACDLSNRKYITKLIELKSWEKFLDWSENENSKSDFINDFSGSTIGQVNQSSEKMDLKSPITQKTVHKTAKETKKKSWVEILAWLIGIIAGLVAIYEFIITNLTN
ncbi:hypothetical protein J8L85_13450 [Maribacter sp. MMG018]|uniref:hypothetical protein n=1 Tax=Maribacter sp. MMG018 TaxID=2822688 RepID=UPI001B379693|nr:hypothetical protein [Maribacter sp. MMG018]MBQ4915454.1 hypothetical protein [Maribacter sp. MMG018]